MTSDKILSMMLRELSEVQIETETMLRETEILRKEKSKKLMHLSKLDKKLLKLQSEREDVPSNQKT